MNIDPDREELIQINKEINRLIQRLGNANWQQQFLKPVIEHLHSASSELSKFRFQVDATEGDL